MNVKLLLISVVINFFALVVLMPLLWHIDLGATITALSSFLLPFGVSWAVVKSGWVAFGGWIAGWVVYSIIFFRIG